MDGMDWRTYLISQKGWQDSVGNTVIFTNVSLEGIPTEQLWIHLDEGLRCGGLHRLTPCQLTAIKDILEGCGKTELWEQIKQDLEGVGYHVCREIDGGSD